MAIRDDGDRSVGPVRRVGDPRRVLSRWHRRHGWRVTTPPGTSDRR